MEVTLGRHQLTVMMEQAKFREMLPELKALYEKKQRAPKRNCKCRSNKASLTDQDFEQAKRGMANRLKGSVTLRELLKSELGCDVVRMKLKRATGGDEIFRYGTG